jgi:hypothetical protein
MLGFDEGYGPRAEILDHVKHCVALSTTLW